MRPKLIIAATDFSQGAEAAFEQALNLAEQHGARLVIAHVVPPLVTPNPLLDDFMVNRTTMALSDGLRENCQAELESRYLKRSTGVEVEEVLLEGDAAKGLVELASERKADLVVVGGTGVSGLAETVFGSVAQKVVRRSPCSVLVARPAPKASH